MADFPLNLLDQNARSEWVRLRTLINLRWLAIFGQGSAVFVASLYLQLSLNIGLCLAAIAASVIFNIVSTIIYPQNKRLSENEVMLTLLFDLSQLVFLLFLSGGLSNPFALLILAPVTISATALRLKSTLFLGATAILLVSIVALYSLPLRTNAGDVLQIPGIFLQGFWIALVIGILFLGVYARRVTLETHSMSQALLATQMALGREQKLTDLGGVVAATAHELGTPLATIMLAGSELVDELEDKPELQADAQLIREQAARCRDILQGMGRAGKDDTQLHYAPLSAVVHEAAEPHASRGKTIHFSFVGKAEGSGDQPNVRRHSEIIHGLRNLCQNAVDFAATDVWVDASWSSETITITIADDGPGYPPDLIGRIGDPFVRKAGTRQIDKQRPEYEGMGLGLFIAKTLLERCGAELTFANGTDPFLTEPETIERSGAIVEVVWPRSTISQPKDANADGPNENLPFTA